MGPGARRLLAVCMSSLAVAFSAFWLSPAGGAPATTTPGFDVLTPEDKLPAVTNNVQWYVAVKVSATLPDSQAGQPSAVLSRRQAKTTWDTVKRALGVYNGEEKYSFVLSISAAGVQLPPLTALQLDHVEDGGLFSRQVETVTVNTVQNVYSPWVPIEKGSKISIKVQHVGSSTPNFSLLNSSSTFANQVATASGLAISPPVQAILTQMASAVTNMVNGATVTNDATLSLDTFPLNGVPAGYSTTMRDTDGNPIAKITFELVFRRSLRSGPETLTATGYPDMGTLAPDDNAYQMLDTTNSIQPVARNLAAQTLLVASLKTPGAGSSGATTFTSGCSSLLSFLENAGLNESDRVFFAVQYLAPTVNARPDLLASFWTNCLSGEQAVADAIGVGGQVHGVVPPTPTTIDLIGKYIVRKGVDSGDQDSVADAQVLQLLGGAITWSGNPDAIVPADAIKKLATLGATNYHCIVRKPIDDPATERTGFTMFLRNGSSPDKVLELSQAMGTDETTPIAWIDYRSPTAAETHYCVKYEASRKPPGTPPTTAM